MKKTPTSLFKKIKAATFKTFLALLTSNSLQAQSGFPDNTFGTDGFEHNQDSTHLIYDIGLQSDGKIIVRESYNDKLVIKRLLSNGQLDLSFGTSGIVEIQDDFYYVSMIALDLTDKSILIQKDDKILIACGNNYYDMVIIRLTEDGVLDPTFANNGIFKFHLGTTSYWTSQILLQDDNKILISGYHGSAGQNDLFLMRLHPNGQIDNSFDTDGIQYLTQYYDTDIRNIMIDSKQRIYVTYRQSAWSSCNTGVAYSEITRWLPNGMVDSTFGINGICETGTALFSALDKNDQLIVPSWNSGINQKIYKLKENGSLDSSFGVNGFLTFDLPDHWTENLSNIKVQEDNKIILVGNAYVGMDCDGYYARLNENGSLDTTFAHIGYRFFRNSPKKDEIALRRIKFQEDGKILFTGSFGHHYVSGNVGKWAQYDYILRVNGDGESTFINSIDMNSAFSFYPNPAMEKIFINNSYFKSEKIEARIFNLEGKLVLNKTINSSNNELDVQDLILGMYILELTSENKKVTSKISKQ